MLRFDHDHVTIVPTKLSEKEKKNNVTTQFWEGSILLKVPLSACKDHMVFVSIVPNHIFSSLYIYGESFLFYKVNTC